jgi:diguanylate cyclase (GGDEF)-like protein
MQFWPGERRLLKVWTSLTAQHDHRLIALAVIVCACATFTAFRVFSRVRRSQGLARIGWLALAGVTGGFGVGAAHFIAMRAYQATGPIGFSPQGPMTALPIIIGMTMAAFAVASADRRRINAAAGGLLFGLGLVGAQAAGIAALRVQGPIAWNVGLLVAAPLLGMGLSTAALLAAGRARSAKAQLCGAVLMTLALFALHFTALAAMTPPVPVPGLASASPLSIQIVTLAAACLAGLFVLAGLGAAQIDSSSSNWALQRVRRLADSAREGIVVVAAGRINDCNAAFCDLVGAPPASLVGRQVLGDLLHLDESPPTADGRAEGWVQPVDGSARIPVRVFQRPLSDKPSAGAQALSVLTIRDQRERLAAEARIRHLAEHDGLTGLPNRHALQTRIKAAMERVASTGESLAVLCADVDGFKETNDSSGHAAGDALLVEAAARLQAVVRAPSFVARLGGDEFIIVQVAAGEQPQASGELASTIVEALKAPLQFEDRQLSLAASLGVSLYPDDGADADSLMANAVMALSRAKDGGGGAFRFFKREMDDTIREQRNLARELRQGLAEEQLVLHYQPLASAADGRICGFEALVRWNHPSRGMVPPLSFIPLAEESGLIGQLGEWVLRRACADAAAWPEPLRIAVNLSPRQLHRPDLPSLVQEVLQTTGLSAHRLELEITETALFDDYERALDNLRRLKSLGVRIAMDDFGTGYSSLSTLRSFPFDKLKIDKSFVEAIHLDDRATAIVRAVLGLGHSLEIPVVAEGVESDEQLDFLRLEGATEVQGYRIGRPAPLSSVAGLITSLSGRRVRRGQPVAA